MSDSGSTIICTFNSNIDKCILKKEIEKIGLYFNPR